MCILFLYFSNDVEDDSWQVIIANNRDELFDRPTASACFWGVNNSCISGLDETTDKKGGTWIGASKNGKIAIELNLLSSDNNPQRKGRGHLVSNFLEGCSTAEEYLDTLKHEYDKYNGFQLILMERIKNEWRASYFCNKEEIRVDTLKPGIYAMTNSPFSSPWKKAISGKESFKRILEKGTKICNHDQLENDLIELLMNNESHLPDPQLLKQSETDLNVSLMEPRSCICVFCPQWRYGTRTNTLLLVNKHGDCEYIERSLKTPVDVENLIWEKNTFNFLIESS